MVKVVTLIPVVITLAAMLVLAVECAHNMATVEVPVAPCTANFTMMAEFLTGGMRMPTKDCTDNVDKCISLTEFYIREALDGVVAAALPANKEEVEKETLKQAMATRSAFGKAKASGNKKEVVVVSDVYLMAGERVLAAAPWDKFKVMEETIKVAASVVA